MLPTYIVYIVYCIHVHYNDVHAVRGSFYKICLNISNFRSFRIDILYLPNDGCIVKVFAARSRCAALLVRCFSGDYTMHI